MPEINAAVAAEVEAAIEAMNGGDEKPLHALKQHIETLEQAVLRTWESGQSPGHCSHCGRFVDVRARNHDPHSPEFCFIPALLEKYADD